MLAPDKFDPSADVLWVPDPQEVTQLDRFAQYVCEKRGAAFKDYADLHRWSVDHPGQFLNDVWDFLGVIGDKGGADDDLVVRTDTPPYLDLFPNAGFNIAENILHGVMQAPDKAAVISRHQDNEDTVFTGQQLYERVSLWQQAFEREGIQAGDHIALSTTNEAEADAIFLAVNSIGAVLMPVGTGMGADMMAKRFKPAEPKLIIAGDGVYEFGPISEEKGAAKENIRHMRDDIINAVRAEVPSLTKTVVVATMDGENAQMDGFENAVSMDEFLSGLKPKAVSFTRMSGNHPFLVNGSSGSTGVPKVFVHGGIGAYLKNMIDHVLHSNIGSDDVYFQHSKQEWMMWPFQHIALATGATILKYNGNPAYPDPYVQFDFTMKHGVTVFGGAAAMVTLAWARDDFEPTKRYSAEQLGRVRLMTSTGSILPKSGFHVVHDIFPKAKIVSITGGTDSLSVNAGGHPKHPTVAGELDGWHLGVRGAILKPDGSHADVGEAGEMAYPQGVPFSMAKSLLGDAHVVQKQWDKYFPNGDGVLYWGDALRQEKHGIVHLGRSGNMLNPFGVAVSVEEVYGPLRDMPEIVDSMVVGFIRPKDGQEMSVLFIESSVDLDAALIEKIRTKIRDGSRGDAIPQAIYQLPQIPKTQTGKTPEVVAKAAMAQGQAPANAAEYDRAKGQNLMQLVADTGKALAEKYAPS